MHAEQVGQFVQPGQRHTPFEPVVDVLRCDAALGGKIGRGQATFVEQGFEDGGFGCYVKVRHTWGESVYAHLTSSPGRPVDFVERGQLIGVSGNTGGSTAPHLHLGIRVDPYRRGDGWGGFCDPLPMLPEWAIDEGLTRGMMDELAEPGKPSGMINNSEV